MQLEVSNETCAVSSHGCKLSIPLKGPAMDNLDTSVGDLVAAIEVLECLGADFETSLLAQAHNSLAEAIMGQLLQGLLVLEVSGGFAVNLATINPAVRTLARQLVPGLGVIFEELADSRIGQAQSDSDNANAWQYVIDFLPCLEDKSHEGGRNLVVGTSLLDTLMQLKLALRHVGLVDDGLLDERLLK